LAAYELLKALDVPPKVVINEGLSLPNGLVARTPEVSSTACFARSGEASAPDEKP
jgi:hypothetical protein